MSNVELLIHQVRPEVSALLEEQGRSGLLDLQESIGIYREIVMPLVDSSLPDQANDGAKNHLFSSAGNKEPQNAGGSRTTHDQILYAAQCSLQRATASSIWTKIFLQNEHNQNR